MYLLGFGFGLDFSIRPPRGCRHIFAFLSARVCTCSRTYVSGTQARSTRVCLYNQKISIGSWHQIKTRTFLRRILLCSRSSDRSSQISEKLRSIVGNMHRKQLFGIIHRIHRILKKCRNQWKSERLSPICTFSRKTSLGNIRCLVEFY